MVYYLPKTTYRVELDVSQPKTRKVGQGNDEISLSTSIGIKCDPVFVADRGHGSFTLHSSTNEFYARDHKVGVSDGLLTSVTVSDDGRLLEIAKALGDTASLVASTQAGPGMAASLYPKLNKPADMVKPGGDQQGEGLFPLNPELPELPQFPSLQAVPPASDGLAASTSEAEAMMLMILPGTHAWTFEKPTDEFVVPGASELISVKCSVGNNAAGDENATVYSAKSWQVPKYDRKQPAMPARRCGPIPGVATKNTTKIDVTIDIMAKSGLVARLRGDVARRNSNALKDYIAQLIEVKRHYDRQRVFVGASIPGYKAPAEEPTKDKDLPGVRTTALGKFPTPGADLSAYQKAMRQIEHTLEVIQTRRVLAEGKLKDNETLATRYEGLTKTDQKIPLKRHVMTVSATIDDRIVVVPLPRGPVGQTTHTLTLHNGILDERAFTTPSAVEGLIQIPIEWAKDIVGIPAAALETETSSLNAEKDLVEARKGLVEKQKELLEKEAELEQAKSGKADDEVDKEE